jgi:hypothetical protein
VSKGKGPRLRGFSTRKPDSKRWLRRVQAGLERGDPRAVRQAEQVMMALPPERLRAAMRRWQGLE